jgi:hypothetical protein
MRRMMRSFVAVAAVGAVLTACTGDTEEPENDPTAGQTDGGESADGEADSVGFGEPAQYDDGVSVTVTEPKDFTPSRNAQVGVEPEFVTFEVMIANGSEAPVAPRRLAITVESAGQQVGQVIDRRKGVSGPPRQRVAPGDELAWDVAFGVIDPTDVTVELQLGLDTDPVVVSGGE